MKDKKCWKEFRDVEWLYRCIRQRAQQSSTGTEPRMAKWGHHAKGELFLLDRFKTCGELSV